MKKIRMILSVLILIFILPGNSALAEEHQKFVHGYPSESGKLHVEGNQLMDSLGQRIQLEGITTHGIAWFPEYINEDCIRQFSDSKIGLQEDF